MRCRGCWHSDFKRLPYTWRTLWLAGLLLRRFACRRCQRPAVGWWRYRTEREVADTRRAARAVPPGTADPDGHR
jgi:hypothetical protein